MLLSDLNAQVVARWRDDRIKEVKAASVVRELNTLSAVLNVARKEWCYDLVNVVEAIKRPAQGQGRTRRLAQGEEAAILEELAPPYRRIVRFALATAMRRGEILALAWKNVDTGERVAVLPMTKNGEPRRVPLSPEALAVLREQAAEKTQAIDGRVFAMPAITLDSAWRRACARAGVEDLHFHDLRREAVSRLLERGFSVAEAAAVSGHKTWKMVQRYCALRAEDLAVKLA
ncbi:MAG: site-specific integrase [Rhodocyclaceae bacterium]|nr:site-specific integrase [Rhodocyclaceae bacterium]